MKRRIKRMAVLAGCNYYENPYGLRGLELSGCINDVVSMKKLLVSRFGFEEDYIELLIDAPGSSNQPTGANIRRALKRMVKEAENGDLLFFHFSGHGTFLRSTDPLDPKRTHEAIISCDINLITDVDFRELIDSTCEKMITFTMISDSCHSGGLINQAKEQIGPSTYPPVPNSKSRSFKRKFIPIESILGAFQQSSGLTGLNIGDFMRLNFRDDASPIFHGVFKFPAKFTQKKIYENGILLSGCQSDEVCQDDPDSQPPHGVFSYAVMTALDNSGRVLSNKELVLVTRKLLFEQGYDEQHPCLYCNDYNVDATFLLERQAHTN